MKSFCIKLDNEKQENFLINQLEEIYNQDFYISSYKFKIYKNVIVHYAGNDITYFMKCFSEKLANTIQKFYEEKLLEKIIHKNYFYLSEDEQESITRISLRILIASKESEDFGKEILKELVYEYLEENKKMILDRFCHF